VPIDIRRLVAIKNAACSPLNDTSLFHIGELLSYDVIMT
jgi:hypothetical protein